MDNIEKQIYGVFILKRNQDHILVLESNNFEEANEVWKSLTNNWETSLKDQKPFIFNKPIVTAFDPGLIYEITLKPVNKSNVKVDSNNPYQRHMEKEGFTNTLNRYGLYDEGYKL